MRAVASLATLPRLFYPRSGGGVVNILLRVAAIYSLAWAIGLAFPRVLPFATPVPTPEMRAMANGLAIANLAFAYIFNRAAADPAAHRGIIYGALILFGLRGVVGTYEVLYLLEGPGAVPQLIDMVLSVALFAALLNTLPGTLQSRRPPS
jgi:hypothetical protein